MQPAKYDPAVEGGLTELLPAGNRDPGFRKHYRVLSASHPKRRVERTIPVTKEIRWRSKLRPATNLCY